jgi:hypothetical protein
VFGGYSMARVKGDVFKGQQHADTWLLEFKGDESDAGGADDSGAAAAAAAKANKEWAWSKIKSGGVEPNLRSGAAMAIRSADGRAYSFGGVEDTEDDDTIDSTFFNNLFVVDVTKRPTWHTVDAPTAGGAAAASAATSDPPTPRINSHICVQGSVLWVYGGSIEHGSRHVTLSDLHYFDLGKKTGQWTQVHGHDRKTAEWLEDESSESEDDDDDDDGGGKVAASKGKKKGPNPLKARLAATPK